jgi:hypothetical protein
LLPEAAVSAVKFSSVELADEDGTVCAREAAQDISARRNIKANENGFIWSAVPCSKYGATPLTHDFRQWPDKVKGNRWNRQTAASIAKA